MTVDEALAELEHALPGLNYVVSLDLHRLPAIAGGSVAQYVSVAIGPEAVVGGSHEISAADMLDDVEKCIRYEGDDGNHADREFIHSPRLDELLACVLNHLQQTASQSTTVWSFWLKDGHPHYPVQWDFAYILAGGGGVEVFIGSSSD